MTRWRLLAASAALLGAASLAGCGFTPLYASGKGESAAELGLGQVSVALIPNREGQLLRQALQLRLEGANGGHTAQYDLYVALAITDSNEAIDQQSASTRDRLTGTASWTLKGQDPAHTTLAGGAGHALDGYDLVNQQFFAATLSRETAVRRMADALADQITQQLAIYFRQHPPS